jgi:hypothetical protein
MKTTGALTLEIRPSLLGQGLVTILAGAGLATVFYVQPSLMVFLVAALVIGAAWSWLLLRLNRPTWRRVVISHQADQVVLIGQGKQRHSGKFSRRLINTGLLVIFSMSDQHGSHRVWLFGDSADRAALARLREILSSGPGG